MYTYDVEIVLRQSDTEPGLNVGKALVAQSGCWLQDAVMPLLCHAVEIPSA